MSNYSNLSTKLLKESKSKKIRPLKGLKLVIKGRLNGIRRTRKSIITHKTSYLANFADCKGWQFGINPPINSLSLVFILSMNNLNLAELTFLKLPRVSLSVSSN